MSVSLAPQTPPLDDTQAERLGHALDGLTREQLQWVSGFTAGLAAANGASSSQAAVQSEASDPANTLTILFGSQTGNGEGLAKQLAADARSLGFAVELHSLADYKPAQLKRERLVSFVISTHGEGDPPDDAELFHEFLMSKKAPPLEALNYALLALGDSSYINFCQTGRELDQRLKELGARQLVPIVECDLDFDAAAASWRDAVLDRIPDVIDRAATARKLHAVDSPPRFDKEHPFTAEVLVNQRITASDSSKDVRHIELSLEGSGMQYRPGDALAVVVENPPQLVAELLDELALDAGSDVRVQQEQYRLGDALTTRLEITAASLGFVKFWADASDDEELRAIVGDPEALAALFDTHQIIDIVRRFPAQPAAQALVDGLRTLSPRSYSISSSSGANPDEVHLTVAAVRYEAFGSQHWGAASTHLADRLREGDTVQVYVEPNSRFRLPDDDATDIIMIGPGTGVAPFRAFVEERAERDASGSSWLIFGDRNFRSDFLYQLEWHRHLKNGVLDRLDVAFSRDQQQKVYVQDRIREHGEELFRWVERGAHIYVCGDAKRMAGDVEDALVEVFAEYGGMQQDKATARLKVLRRDGRYQRDVY